MIIFHSNDVSSSKLVSDRLLIDQWFGSGISEIVQTKVEVGCLLRLSLYNACRTLFRSARCKLSSLISHSSVLITFAGLKIYPIVLRSFRPFGFIAPKNLNYLVFQSFDFEHTWWTLFQKRVLHTRFDICVICNDPIILKCFTLMSWRFQLALSLQIGV